MKTDTQAQDSPQHIGTSKDIAYVRLIQAYSDLLNSAKLVAEAIATTERNKSEHSPALYLDELRAGIGAAERQPERTQKAIRALNNADKLAEALRDLANASATIGNLDHAGAPIPADAWADMYAANNAARAALAAYEAEL